MGFFGPSKNELWESLAQDLGTEVVHGGFRGGNRIQAQAGPWTVTLDTYTVPSGKTHITYTRMRAPYVNPEGFRFTIYRKGLLSGLGKMLGMQDIEVGHPDFDDAFIIKATDEAKVRDLCDDGDVRALMMAQPEIRLSVVDSEGWFGPSFPEGVDELHFQVVGVIQDVDRLKRLFELFTAVLERLVEMRAAREEPPGVTL